MNAVMLALSAPFFVSMLQTFFPGDQGSITTVRLTAGLSQPGEHDSSGVGGDKPNVGVFDGDGQRIGYQKGAFHGFIDDGQPADIAIHPIDWHNRRKTEYISVTAAGPNAFCLASVYVTDPESNYFSWNGEFAKSCGADWYPSRDLLQGSTTFRPSCVWMSNDGRFAQGYSMHLPSFSGNDDAKGTQYKNHPETLCQSKPRQAIWKKMTEYNCVPYFRNIPDVSPHGGDADFSQVLVDGDVACSPAPDTDVTDDEKTALDSMNPNGGYGTKKRDNQHRRTLIQRGTERGGLPTNKTSTNRHLCQHQLVISTFDEHSAKEVCDSESSWGPDFVSTVEGYYCDMCEHTLWQLCSEQVTQGCFDMQTQSLLPGKNELNARDDLNGQSLPNKTFINVHHWK